VTDGPPPDPPPAEALRLPLERLRRRCDPDALGFATTAELEPLAGAIGQPRALEAIEFGLLDGRGFNVFATGPAGTGKRTVLERQLRQRAAERPAPDDLVCLFNFRAEGRPLIVALPTGVGPRLADDTRELVAEARRRVREAFESEGYGERRKRLTDELESRAEEALTDLREFAHEHGLALELTPAGLMTIPTQHGEPMPPDQFTRLPAEMQATFAQRAKEIEARAPEVMRSLRAIEREGNERLRALDREVAHFAVGHLIEELAARYAEVPRVGAWLDEALEDIVENVARFRADAPPDGESPGPVPAIIGRGREEFFGRYEANPLVSHEEDGGAPVVFASNPTYPDLFGRIEYESSFGAVSTDHRFVRAGAIHRADGGYLVLEALEVLGQPLVWDKLKETLRAGRARIENPGAQFMLFPTTTLEPEPTELDLKIVLVGSVALHRMLYELDEDLRKLFKVRADFDVEMPWTDEGVREYAAFVSRRVRDAGLRHFSSDAVAGVVEHAARTIGHQERLSTRFLDVADLVTEADHWAGRDGSELVRAAHVETAIERARYRSNLVEEKIHAAIDEGTLLVDVAGEATGAVNGLAVAGLGDLEFGHPVKVTATVGPGDGDVVNVDREAKLSGPIQTKGVLILAGYLRDRFADVAPLALRASLVFEQSYAGVEGDSAAAAELFALLSALARAPVRQEIAVTGSVDQHGHVQPIGGVNEKIEGFFAACRLRGLSGEQGVVIPAANVKHLMLRREVLEAVGAGAFHVWAIGTVEEGIELLTGLSAAAIDERIAERVRGFAELAKRFRGDGS
jgi:lon-related putative ATP-dependent protease